MFININSQTNFAASEYEIKMYVSFKQAKTVYSYIIGDNDTKS